MDDPLLLIEAEIPALRRYARFLLHDADAADDLVQDCLLRAVARIHLWRPGNLRGWLFTILRNLHRLQWRAARRHLALLSLVETVEPDTAPAQCSCVEVGEALAAFRRLPVDQQEVLFLIAVQGLRYREAAQLLHVPIGTVMSRLARARERLRTLVEEPASAPPRLRSVK